jgi:hypothetical protein
MTNMSFNDQRLVARTSIYRGGLLFFGDRQGVRGFRVVNISQRGVKLRTHRLAILPITFEVTLDNFTTVYRCRLVWRSGELIGAAFEV